MMKLKRLEISGFKSFPDPVTVQFHGGITAIVGPNGCGKSNLSDAVTWVLGEQSAKSMRADTMEDVIFNGSEKRKPLGMADVTLTFQAEPGFLGSDDGLVTISRRVFRSGESQYRLNGKVTRLKDVKDLLMDTGLGVRAYSVIEQGKIGLILSGKPQERPIALVGATVHTVSGADLENATLLFDEGKIVAIDQKLKLPADAEVIDVKGKHIYPTLIDPFTNVGLVEIEAVRATRDQAETGSINPNAKAQVAFNPDSELIPVARSNGVLALLSAPTGGLISASSIMITM